MTRSRIPVQKNEEHTVTIEDLTYQGYGVAKIAGFSIFIENTLPGEIVRIRIEKTEKRFAYGKCLEIITASPDRVIEMDLLGTRVGTMPLQHFSYPAQLQFKKQQVINNLSKVMDIAQLEITDTIGMAHPWQYRNKASIPVRMVKDRLETGFFRRGSHRLVPIENYHIQDPVIDSIIIKVRDILRQHDCRPYDEIKHTGDIRHIIVRKGHYTDQVMIILVSAQRDLNQRDAITQAILTTIENVVSIIQNINGHRTNVIMGDELIVWHGNDYYEDILLDKHYRISARSFYQVNTLQTEKLYQKVLEFADIQPDETVVDAYCGIGTITLNLAEKAKIVYGIEIVEDAITMAKENAKRNRIDNVHFQTGDAREVFSQWQDGNFQFDILVVDPPRKGLDIEFVNAVITAKPKKIVYVSCNPATLARDLLYLVNGGYRVEKVQPVDMFPQTTHVECITLLIRK